MCEAHMNEVIRKLVPNAKKVTSSHSKGESTFISEEKIDMEKMREAIEETGYHFISMESEPYEKKRWFGKR